MLVELLETDFSFEVKDNFGFSFEILIEQRIFFYSKGDFRNIFYWKLNIGIIKLDITLFGQIFTM